MGDAVAAAGHAVLRLAAALSLCACVGLYGIEGYDPSASAGKLEHAHGRCDLRTIASAGNVLVLDQRELRAELAFRHGLEPFLAGPRLGPLPLPVVPVPFLRFGETQFVLDPLVLFVRVVARDAELRIAPGDFRLARRAGEREDALAPRWTDRRTESGAPRARAPAATLALGPGESADLILEFRGLGRAAGRRPPAALWLTIAGLSRDGRALAPRMLRFDHRYELALCAYPYP